MLYRYIRYGSVCILLVRWFCGFSNLSTLLVLSWDGQLKKRLNFDRSIKRIAVDPSDRFLVALALDESGALDVVKYSI